MDTRTHPVVLFDDDCALCAGIIKLLLEHKSARHLRFAALQSPLAKQLAGRFGRDPLALDTVLFIEDGRLYIKSAAALRVTRHLSPPWRWLQVLMLLPRPLRDWCYDQVARLRNRLWRRRDNAAGGARVDHPSRFID
jgi:predicted DCC family thiol-disulfide oxidoreductase YuxK